MICFLGSLFSSIILTETIFDCLKAFLLQTFFVPCLYLFLFSLQKRTASPLNLLVQKCFCYTVSAPKGHMSACLLFLVLISVSVRAGEESEQPMFVKQQACRIPVGKICFVADGLQAGRMQSVSSLFCRMYKRRISSGLLCFAVFAGFYTCDGVCMNIVVKIRTGYWFTTKVHQFFCNRRPAGGMAVKVLFIKDRHS